jgi:hypothetical protein
MHENKVENGGMFWPASNDSFLTTVPTKFSTLFPRRKHLQTLAFFHTTPSRSPARVKKSEISSQKFF